MNRAVGNGVAAGLLCTYLAHQPARALPFGLRIGLTVGLVTTASSVLSPMVEWGADRIPQKRMGVFGVALILIGFSLQSVQYWMTLMDVTVR